MKIKLVFCMFVATLFLTNCQDNTPMKAPSFDTALNMHLKAIQGRNLKDFKATITNGETLPIIFPGGAMMDSKTEILKVHKDWFSDPKWIWEPEILRTYVSGNLAVATVKYDYRDTADGEPRSAILGLVFELQKGEWRLVHDQNTRIDKEE